MRQRLKRTVGRIKEDKERLEGKKKMIRLKKVKKNAMKGHVEERT